MSQPLFPTFFLGGFECSTQIRQDHQRLDIIDSTQHDRFALQDYRALQNQGIGAARDGIRWHRIEATPGQYDWSSALPQIHAARETKTQLIWDLSHYGWPDHLDIFSSRYVESFAKFARAFAQLLKDETPGPHFISPVNEISFFSWAGGEAAYFNPLQKGRGEELKRQLVRSAIAATSAVWEILPEARIVHCDPIICVQPRPDHPEDVDAARGHTDSQFAAWEMIAGRRAPELGGQEKYLDIVGANYYVHNQWYHHGDLIEPSNPKHRRVRELLADLYDRLNRPILIAETGIEDDKRPAWLRYIGGEVRAALAAGIPIEGICLYPICDHPGWDRGRHRHNGLFDYHDETGHRAIYEPLAVEIKRQSFLIAELQAASTAEKLLLVASEAQALAELDESAREMQAKTRDVQSS